MTTPNLSFNKASEYKLYQYHSTELKSRIFYLFLTFIFCFTVTFYNMEFILYKITPSVKPFQKHIQESLHAADADSEMSSFFLFRTEDAHAETLSEAKLEGAFETQTKLEPMFLDASQLEVKTQLPHNLDFIFTDIFEAFLSYIVLSSYLSFLLSLPFIYYHLYKFLQPGLSYTESTLFRYLFYTSLFLIVFALILTYTIILPYATSFFLTFQTGTSQTFNGVSTEHFPEFQTIPNIAFLSRIYSWILFLIHLFTAVSFLFQLPLLLFVLFLLILKPTLIYKTHVSPAEGNDSLLAGRLAALNQDLTLFKRQNTTFLRKLLFFLLVLITAVFSPPDLYSQFFLFVPLFFIIEIFIFALFFYFEYIKKQLLQITKNNN